MAILLSDAGLHRHLLPLTYTRPVGALRAGMLTVAEAWWRMTEMPVGYRTQPYLQAKFPEVIGEVVREVHGGLLPTPDVVGAILDLVPGEALVKDGKVLAFCEAGMGKAADIDWQQPPPYVRTVPFTGEAVLIERPWHLFQHCGKAIINDFVLLTDGRRSQPVSTLNTVIGDPGLIFLEEGARVEGVFLNTTAGPIHIGRDAEVMEGTMVRGPFALGEGAQVKMGAKIYGATAVGPGSRVGGEVSNCVFLGYSNKGHDGFMGNSVIGEWCNLGADTNTSNLKNTYGEVSVWSYVDEAMRPTGLQFCGLLMGDHSRAGINTMFNTGTVVGLCANVFDAGFPAKHVPSYSWGGASGWSVYDPEKALMNAARMMERRQVPLTAADEGILRHVFQATAAERT